MSRVIRFRVWDKSCGEWITGPCEYTQFEEIFSPNEGKWYENDWVFQQFTGLFDAAGVEIYEGDIIKEKWRENNPYGYCPDEWDDKENIFAVKYKAPSFVFPQRRHEQRCIEDYTKEVIGNICENPELLK